MWRLCIALLVSLTTLWAQEWVSQPFDESDPPEGSGHFVRLPSELTGIDLVHHFPPEAPFILMTDQYSGAGVCIGDVDGDQLPDVFFTNYDRGNRLYKNLGHWRFRDITEAAGVDGKGRWSAGPCFVDIDSDGDLDLYVCVYRQGNLLYLNDGKGRFTEAAREAGLDSKAVGVMAAFADYDRDGDLDMYLVTHRDALDPRSPKPASSREAFERGILRTVEDRGARRAVVNPEFREFFEIMPKGEGRIELITAGQPDHLYQNDGQGHFDRVDQAAGIHGNDIGLSAIWWDANDDGYPDLYVSNDYKGPDHLYLNRKNGAFEEVTRTALPHVPWLSMGADFADIDNDGLLDLFATDMAGSDHYSQKVSMGDMSKDRWFLIRSDPRQYMRNALFLNTGTNRFAEVAYLTGTAESDWTWCPKFGDFDQDGWTDLFITNGMSRDFMNSDLANRLHGAWRNEAYRHTPVLRQKNLAFRNGGDLRFENAGAPWHLDDLTASYGAATGDLDRDGDLDLIVCNFDDPVSIYRNEIGTGSSLTLTLIGSRSARMPLGAKVTLHSGNSIQVRELASSRGFMAADEPILHFGLGSQARVDRLIIRWPSGHEQMLENLAPGHHYTITEPDRDLPNPAPVRAAYFRLVEQAAALTHRETPFDDYARQPLLPMSHSQLGPALAVGDVDGDGKDDVFLGGAAGFSGQLRLSGVSQTASTGDLDDVFRPHASSEDVDAHFFDSDGDGDLDVYVVSGGVEGKPGDAVFRDRLYLNDGRGRFSHTPDRLPDLSESGSVVASGDIDRDGDADLFLGARLIPGRYPETPESRLLINEGGSFRIDEGNNGEVLRLSGLVTDAALADIDADGWLDLLVAHEWGPLKCYRNLDGKLKDDTEASGLSDLEGWWYSLAIGDVDSDGDLDFAAGNVGLNTKYHASAEHPAKLYYGDFGRSGEKHLVEAGFEGDILYPKRGKSCSTGAMPFLGRRFTTYHDFAKASLTQIYGSQLDDALELSANTLESGIFLNDGKGRFAFVPLPRMAQLAPIRDLVFIDLDDDGALDLLLAHNDYSPQPETGRFDGGVSLVLKGRKNGRFDPIPPHISGIVVPGAAAKAKLSDWNADGLADLYVAVNDGPLLAFERVGPARASTTD